MATDDGHSTEYESKWFETAHREELWPYEFVVLCGGACHAMPCRAVPCRAVPCSVLTRQVCSVTRQRVIDASGMTVTGEVDISGAHTVFSDVRAFVGCALESSKAVVAPTPATLSRS